MKIQILILALFIMPFIAFTQQAETIKYKKNQETELNKQSSSLQRVDQKKGHSIDLKALSNLMTESFRRSNNIPEDFPRLKNTGDQKSDDNIYYDEMRQWIELNPERFDKINILLKNQ